MMKKCVWLGVGCVHRLKGEKCFLSHIPHLQKHIGRHECKTINLIAQWGNISCLQIHNIKKEERISLVREDTQW
jgi:hypothetical protein